MSSPVISSPRFSATWASVSFDLMRGVAAFIVLYEHWRNLLFVDYGDIHAHRLLLAPMYLIATAGHSAVVVFFVLSGYFIGGTVFRAVESGEWRWSSYLLRRFVRLWTVLLPGLLLCLLWDRLGLHLGHAPSLYAGQGSNHMLIAPVLANLSPHAFFGNLFFLQGIRSPLYGSNTALWSISYEFWYYILFPLGLLAVLGGGRGGRGVLARRIACAAAFLLIASLVGHQILTEFPVWLAGALLAKVPPPRFSDRTGRRLRIIAPILYLPVLLSAGRVRLPFPAPDYILAAFTFVLLWILLSARTAHPARTPAVVFSREIARFSFSLYLVHAPFLTLLTSFAEGDTRRVPGLHSLGIALLILAATIVYAYVVAFLTEFRTDALRRRVEWSFGLRSAPPLLPSNPLDSVS